MAKVALACVEFKVALAYVPFGLSSIVPSTITAVEGRSWEEGLKGGQFQRRGKQKKGLEGEGEV